VDLASNWEDIDCPERRRDIVKIRYDVHTIASQFLMQLDRQYHTALGDWVR
jgi:hypothetical protein